MSQLLAKTSSPFRLKLEVARGSAQDFELWHWGVSPMFGMDARDRRARTDFTFDATSYQFADVAVASAKSSATAFERTTKTIARSGIDTIDVLIYLAGGYSLDVEGRAAEVHAGDVCILDMTRPATLRTTDYTHLSIVLPRATLEPLLPNLDALHGLILPRGTSLNTMLVAHLRALYAEAPALGLQDGRAAAEGTAALIAAFVSPRANGRHETRRATSIATIQALRRVIENHLGDPALGPEFLMRRVAVSRASLYRLFEPLGGVRSYIQQRRLTRAFQTISNPAQADQRIGSIARRHGFTNDTVFSRAFRDAYGLSPTEMRMTAKAGYFEEMNSPGGAGGSFWAVNRWLLGIDASLR
ncbi:MAG TPA: helix-turn-helix domain-containing protein [Steroidobacteraceae bacterium]